jgi:lipid II:glycine glycyltransferase (peptidoglycan interpeptide bridge formation enzyme)
VNYSVRVSRDLFDPEWDDFAAHCPDGHHEQSSMWAQVKHFYGWNVIRIIVAGNGRILGGAQILERKVKGLIKIGYLLRGPLSFSEVGDLQGIIVREIDAVVKDSGISCLILVPSYDGHSFLPHLKNAGFVRKPDYFPPTGLPQASLLLDLSDDLDRLLGRMRRTTRQEIRKSGREGMTVREAAGEADVETFRRLMYALCERRDVKPTPPQKDFFKRLSEVFVPRGCLKILIVNHTDTPVAAGLLFTFGSTVRFWKMGWAGDHEEKNPTNFLYWEAIKWAKVNNFDCFDISHLELNCAIALREGTVVTPGSTDGMSFFKAGFGGKAVILPESLCKFYLPLPRGFMRWGGERILSSKWFEHLVGKRLMTI